MKQSFKKRSNRPFGNFGSLDIPRAMWHQSAFVRLMAKPWKPVDASGKPLSTRHGQGGIVDDFSDVAAQVKEALSNG